MDKSKIATIVTVILLVLGFIPVYTLIMLNVNDEYRTLLGWLIPLIYSSICIVVNIMIIFSPTSEEREKQLVDELEELGYTVTKDKEN